jgi:hypothetical protein
MKIVDLIKLTHIMEEIIILQSTSLKNNQKYYKKLVSELNSCKKYIRENKQECINKYYKNYQEKSILLDFNIYQHIDLFLLLSENFNGDNPKLSSEIKNEEQYQQLTFFCRSLCNLTNSLISIRSLLEQGFDLQAKQLFRCYIEYADISIASLASQDFYKNYKRMAESEEDEKDVWWNYTRPIAITKILKKIYLTFDNNGKVWEITNMIRQPSYKSYSDYIHGHFMANTLSAFGQSVEDESYSPTITGAITTNMDDTLDKSIIYSHLAIKHAMILLVKDHHFPFTKFGEQGEKFVVFYKIMERLWPKMMEQLNMFKGKQ